MRPDVILLRDSPILVTGGAGFIGSHLVDALTSAGARVTVFDNLQAGSWVNVREKPSTAEAEIGKQQDAS